MSDASRICRNEEHCMDATLAPAALGDATVVQCSMPRYGIVVARDVMVVHFNRGFPSHVVLPIIHR